MFPNSRILRLCFIVFALFLVESASFSQDCDTDYTALVDEQSTDPHFEELLERVEFTAADYQLQVQAIANQTMGRSTTPHRSPSLGLVSSEDQQRYWQQQSRDVQHALNQVYNNTDLGSKPGPLRAPELYVTVHITSTSTFVPTTPGRASLLVASESYPAPSPETLTTGHAVVYSYWGDLPLQVDTPVVRLDGGLCDSCVERAFSDLVTSNFRHRNSVRVIIHTESTYFDRATDFFAPGADNQNETMVTLQSELDDGNVTQKEVADSYVRTLAGTFVFVGFEAPAYVYRNAQTGKEVRIEYER